MGNVVNARNILDTRQTDLTHQILTDIHDGQTDFGEYVSDMLQDLPVSIYWGHLTKNEQDIIWEGSNLFEAKLFGKKHPDNMVGSSVRECFVCEDQANDVIAEEKYVMQNNVSLFHRIRPITCSNGTNLLISGSRFPRYDSSWNVVGAMAINIDVTGLRQSTLTTMKQLLDVAFDEILQTFKSKRNYYIATDKPPIRLTARQAECLTYLAMGKTLKQIASMLNCSSRTIEDHVNLLKNKLGVYSTAELIDCFWRNPIGWF